MFFVSNLPSSSRAGRHAAMPLSKQTDEVREPYANIKEPKLAQTILCHPKSLHLQPFSRQSHPLITSHLAISVGGPEKAGVGGSSPSLATTTKLRPFIELWALFSVIGLSRCGSVESIWSPNSSRLRSWYPWWPSWGPCPLRHLLGLQRDGTHGSHFGDFLVVSRLRRQHSCSIQEGPHASPVEMTNRRTLGTRWNASVVVAR